MSFDTDMKTSSKRSVAAVTISIPPFKSNDPYLWFTRLEHYFLDNHVTSQIAKFGYASSILPDEIAEQVREMLINLNPETPYDVLKQKVIKVALLSDQKAIDRLLGNVSLGDRTPYQLKSHLCNILGDQKVDTRFFYQLWLRWLPHSIHQILAFGAEDRDIEKLAEIANRMYERMSPQVTSLLDKSSDECIEALERKIDVLNGQLMTMRFIRQPITSYRRQRSRPRNLRKYSLQQQKPST
ncbi:unnamed protein product [Trichobilharzia regenti]|nr:unnamed protein product [Trichobilharzia regenti]